MKIVISLLLVITLLSTVHEASAAAEPAPGGVAVGPITGTVLETMDAAGYTYMRLKTAKGEIWAAVQKATVKKGSEVTVLNAVSMDGFESRTLKRRFDHIVFGNLGTGSSPQEALSPLASGHGAPADKQAQETLSAQHAKVANAPVDAGKIKVKKAEGADAKTVAEIFAGKASLKDTSVAVHGKVVKYNPGIMGKNWMHLRDGSGSPEKKDDDITVTTLDSAAVGDVVLVRGTVHLDRDFGAGYAYPVIIEDAKVSK